MGGEWQLRGPIVWKYFSQQLQWACLVGSARVCISVSAAVVFAAPLSFPRECSYCHLHYFSKGCFTATTPCMQSCRDCLGCSTCISVAQRAEERVCAPFTRVMPSTMEGSSGEGDLFTVKHELRNGKWTPGTPSYAYVWETALVCLGLIVFSLYDGKSSFNVSWSASVNALVSAISSLY